MKIWIRKEFLYQVQRQMFQRSKSQCCVSIKAPEWNINSSVFIVNWMVDDIDGERKKKERMFSSKEKNNIHRSRNMNMTMDKKNHRWSHKMRCSFCEVRSPDNKSKGQVSNNDVLQAVNLACKDYVESINGQNHRQSTTPTAASYKFTPFVAQLVATNHDDDNPHTCPIITC